MKKILKILIFISITITILTAILYEFFSTEIFLTLLITFGTTTYHFAIRLLISAFINKIMNNHADYYKRWYQPYFFEETLYKILRVKRWKNIMPTYNPDLFLLKEHTLEEVIQAMCQAEIIHEIIIVWSFLPLLVSIKFGTFYIFLITSIIAGSFDMMFVIIQRYNRPRMMKLVKKQNKLCSKSNI